MMGNIFAFERIKSWVGAFAVLGVISLSPYASAQSVVDTRIGPSIGEANLNAYSPYVGQSYLVQADQTSLLSFSFWISGGEGSSFKASIYDLSAPSGSLFTSDITPGVSGSALPHEYHFLTPGITLTPFDLYVFLLHYEGGGGSDLMVSVQPLSSFHGVGLVSQDGTNFFSLGANTEFRAEFQDTLSPVPEPETYAMLLAGLGLLGFVARRRRAKEAATS